MRLHFMMANEAPRSTNVRFNVGRDAQTQIDDFRISSGGLWALQPLAPDWALKSGSARLEVAHCFGHPWRYRLLARMITSVQASSFLLLQLRISLLRIWLWKTRSGIQRLSALQTDHDYHPPSAPDLTKYQRIPQNIPRNQKNSLWQALIAARTEH